MAGLTCSVNTCANHNGGYCCRNSIKVDGPSAVMKDQTLSRREWKVPSNSLHLRSRQPAHGDPLLGQPLRDNQNVTASADHATFRAARLRG